MTVSPETDGKIRFGVWGFVSGACVAMIVGFVWGGWTTSGTTQKMSDEAVLTSRVAICVAQFMHDPGYKKTLEEFRELDSYKRSELIEKGGWDKMPGQEKAAWGVSAPCVAGVEALTKTGV